jgi:pimeloyl-ACP methyl ester carboxylesterase
MTSFCMFMVLVALWWCARQYDRLLVDCQNPINFILYSPPRHVYNARAVTFWVPKHHHRPQNQEEEEDEDEEDANNTTSIPCYYAQCEATAHTSISDRRLCVYSHGSAEDIVTSSPFLNTMAKTLSVDVLTYDYSGYGLNAFVTNERTAVGLAHTLRLVCNTALNMGYQTKNITLIGYSLGGCPSLLVASTNHTFSNIVLLGVYATQQQLLHNSVPLQLRRLLVPVTTTDNVRVLPLVQVPVLVVHGTSNRSVSSRQAQQLVASNSAYTTLSLIENMGSDLHWAPVLQALATFFGVCAKE